MRLISNHLDFMTPFKWNCFNLRYKITRIKYKILQDFVFDSRFVRDILHFNTSLSSQFTIRLENFKTFVLFSSAFSSHWWDFLIEGTSSVCQCDMPSSSLSSRHGSSCSFQSGFCCLRYSLSNLSPSPF